MTQPVTIVLLGQPVPWARTQGGKSGARFTPAKQRNNAATLRLAAQEAMGHRYAQTLLSVIEVPVQVEILAEMQIPASWSRSKRDKALLNQVRPAGRPDLSNIIKQVEDALNGVVFRDDALVAEIRARKRYGVQPKLVITVSTL